jgi:hypothetical protein
MKKGAVALKIAQQPLLSKDQTGVSGFDASDKDRVRSVFFINRRPKEPGPQLLAMAEEAFCKYTRSKGQYCCTRFWIYLSFLESIPA